MSALLAHIAKENLVTGYRAEVDNGTFSFQISTKALKPEDATTLGLSFPPNGVVWPCDFCNSKIDQHNERFPKEILDRFAAQLNGKEMTFNLYHENQRGVGKTLQKATVEAQADGSYTLKGYVWIGNKYKLKDQDVTVNDAIADGVYKEVSVEVMGRVKYIEEGSTGYLEYYVDPERPQYPKIFALALVQNGAQGGSELKVKSLQGGNNDPQKENNLPKNMIQFSDKFLLGGELLAIKTAEKGGAIEIEGLSAIFDKANKAIADLATANTAKDAAIAEKSALDAEIKAFREPLINKAVALQAIAKTASPKSAEDLGKLKAAELVTLVDALTKEVEGEGSTHKSVDYQSVNTEAY